MRFVKTIFMLYVLSLVAWAQHTGGGQGGNGGGGTITAVVAGTGLTGGGSTGSVTLALIVPVLPANGGTGVANTATFTLGSSNVNLATLGTGIMKNTTATGAITDAAAADVYGLFTSCTGSSGLFLKDGGICAAVGTVNANSGSAGAIANYAAAGGSTTVGPDTKLTDASNTLTYAGTGGMNLSSNSAALSIGTTNPLSITNDGSGRLTTAAAKLTSYLDLPSGTGIYDSAGSEGNAGAPLYSLGGTLGVLWAGDAVFTNSGATLTLGLAGGSSGQLALTGTSSGTVSWLCNPTTTCGTMQTSAAVSMGKASSGAFVSNGTKFTTNQGCGENTSTNLVGGASAGTITTAGSTSCTTIVTIGGSLSSSNGWSCTVIDLTTAGDLTNPHQTASSTTTATFVTGTIVSGDKLQFSCVGY